MFSRQLAFWSSLTCAGVVTGLMMTPGTAQAQSSHDPCGTHVHNTRTVSDTTPPVTIYPEGPVSIPVTIHAVRRSDGSGGWDLENLDRLLDQLNRGFEATPFTFCRPLPIQELLDDTFFEQIDTRSEIDALRLTGAVPGTINIYFVDDLADESGPLCGVSSFSSDPVQGIIIKNICDGTPTITEQVGHYFDLYHTHETAFGVECTSGENCDIAGDLLCDTPADPDLAGRTNAFTCEYTGDVPPPCPDDPPYAPLLDNYMSAASGRCKAAFTPGQIDRMLDVLLTRRIDLLAMGCQPFPRYEITRLGALDDDVSSLASSVNLRGQVVGTSLDASGNPRAFSWSTDGIVALPTLNGYESSSIATDVNAAGVISGWSQSATGRRRATVWAGGTVINLGVIPNDHSSEANAISDGNVVAGVSSQPSQQLATAWRRPFAPLFDPQLGFGSEARDINASGSIVGVTQFNRGPQAFSYIAGELDIIELDLGTISAAHGINASHEIVGWSAPPDHPARRTATLWSNGTSTSLDRLAGSWSVADDITEDRWVVGRAETATPDDVVAFIHHEGTTIDVNWLTLETDRIVRADAINGARQIAGTLENSAGTTAVLLTPAMLNLNRPSPGIADFTNRVIIHGAGAGNEVTLLASTRRGTTAFPSCDAIPLHIAAPMIVATAIADEEGIARVSFEAPAAARGIEIVFQAVDASNCTISQTRSLVFD